MENISIGEHLRLRIGEHLSWKTSQLENQRTFQLENWRTFPFENWKISQLENISVGGPENISVEEPNISVGEHLIWITGEHLQDPRPWEIIHCKEMFFCVVIGNVGTMIPLCRKCPLKWFYLELLSSQSVFKPDLTTGRTLSEQYNPLH